MNIAIIATIEQEIEFKLLIKKDTILLNFFSNLEEVEGKYDAIFDFLYDDSTQRIASLLQLNSIIFINSVSFVLHSNYSNFIRFTGWNSFINRPVFEIAVAKNNQVDYNSIFKFLDIQYVCVPDVIGLVTPRVVSMIINEAYYALDEGVSTKNEIDIAMKLGTNYPYGPFEWAEKIGLKNIYNLLQKLNETEKRYKPSFHLENEQLK
jgi:3-hydroxybutyryl-CoA dehydrogenase